MRRSGYAVVAYHRGEPATSQSIKTATDAPARLDPGTTVSQTRLPRNHARKRGLSGCFSALGVLYVGGALGLEMVVGYMGMVSETDGIARIWFLLEETTEEFLEMTGAIVFFYALTGYCEEVTHGKNEHAAAD